MCEVDNQATAKKSLRSEENKKIFKEDISRRNLHIYQEFVAWCPMEKITAR